MKVQNSIDSMLGMHHRWWTDIDQTFCLLDKHTNPYIAKNTFIDLLNELAEKAIM